MQALYIDIPSKKTDQKNFYSEWNCAFFPLEGASPASPSSAYIRYWLVYSDDPPTLFACPIPSSENQKFNCINNIIGFQNQNGWLSLINNKNAIVAAIQFLGQDGSGTLIVITPPLPPKDLNPIVNMEMKNSENNLIIQSKSNNPSYIMGFDPAAHIDPTSLDSNINIKSQ